MNKKLQTALFAINFIKRFEAISKAHQSNNKFENPDIKIVINIMERYGYTVKYVKKHKYYKIDEKEKNKYNTYLQPIDIEIGIVNMQISTDIDGEWAGGQFRLLCRNIDYEEKVSSPRFSSYEELEIILKELFDLYEDLKKELLKDG